MANPKQIAAEAALPFIQDGMTVGLGTGSTAEFFIAALGRLIRDGKIHNVTGIPTSHMSEALARTLNIPVTTLAEHPVIDVTVDGADEVDPHLDLIKGLGGALLREKIIAQNSRKVIIIVDESKVVPTLGAKGPLPVEVTPFSHQSHLDYFRSLGGEPVLRVKPDGSTFITDNGNYIYDCRFGPIADPAGLELKLRQRAGIVETGLFVGLASLILIGLAGGSVRQLKRP